MQNESILQVRNLTVDFRADGSRFRAVDGVEFDVQRGETLVILGESGSGKSVSTSTVLDLLDVPPAEIVSGTIKFGDDDLLRLSERRRRDINGRRIGIVFQDPLSHLNPLETVGAQLAEVFEVHTQLSRREVQERCVRLLDRVGIADAEARMKDYPHQFSGGQRQRVMIAMAVALDPDLIIADEPTTALDVSVQAQILDLFRSLQKEKGLAIIMITHDLDVAAAMGDRVVVMRNGRVVETGPTRTVFEQPADSYTATLIDASKSMENVDAKVPTTGQPILSVKGVCKDYIVHKRRGGKIRALDDVALEIRPGETLAVVGESGSGKSTLARVLMRLEGAEGNVAFQGADVLSMKGRELLAYRKDVQMIFQDPVSSLNPKMRVRDIIAEPWRVHRGLVARDRWQARVQQLLQEVGLKCEHAERFPHEFSGGQKQRIAIARALACEPRLIICDEAVSALDVSVQAQIIELLENLQKKTGIAYLFITHDLPVVRGLAHRVVVMRNGKIVEHGPTEEIFHSPKADYTRMLMAARPIPAWQQ